MPLKFFYTMVQKSQKWPKTQIKGGPALNIPVEHSFVTCSAVLLFFAILIVPAYHFIGNWSWK